MKSVKCLLPLLFLIAVLFCGCTSREEKKIEEVIKRELDLLKNLDSDTTQKYLSYQELFEDGTLTRIKIPLRQIFAWSHWMQALLQRIFQQNS